VVALHSTAIREATSEEVGDGRTGGCRSVPVAFGAAVAANRKARQMVAGLTKDQATLLAKFPDSLGLIA
jgi:hypothetical protein